MTARRIRWARSPSSLRPTCRARAGPLPRPTSRRPHSSLSWRAVRSSISTCSSPRALPSWRGATPWRMSVTTATSWRAARISSPTASTTEAAPRVSRRSTCGSSTSSSAGCNSRPKSRVRCCLMRCARSAHASWSQSPMATRCRGPSCRMTWPTRCVGSTCPMRCTRSTRSPGWAASSTSPSPRRSSSSRSTAPRTTRTTRWARGRAARLWRVTAPRA
mmetsp:Transcript_32626/g.77644  ORF Transcript_32626/g.77644 Transcript_32626/m.77644 type:complete len:218 (+) Transcript_32626:390-1043(+)